ncbi:hypothetical protein [Marinomonas colpomeniae]|uniref:Uncharacterized protein n=1 Tax=Marinomonas colpomeniae TaxID=2774408 RepID=A0ABR8P0S6_9GAMM|nr:hypothetical protein [Marinomonas colpomeniae]MBD5771899.1 hypothetical protein [Marinomonas colpomeniae]
MKKIFLRRLRSLTAILVLNTVPVSFAETGLNYEVEVLQARVLSNDRKNTLNSKSGTIPLERLYLENTVAHMQEEISQKVLGGQSATRLSATQLNSQKMDALIHQYQMALALIEEAYQDDYDELLDLYEQALHEAISEHDSAKIEETKEIIFDELMQLKLIKIAKIDEVSKQFEIS